MVSMLNGGDAMPRAADERQPSMSVICSSGVHQVDAFNQVGTHVAVFQWYWTEKQHDLWARKRAKGVVRFVLSDGLAAWGGTMFLIMAVGPAMFGVPYRASPTPLYWLWQALLWATAGLLFGSVTWYFCERQYEKHTQSAL
jgi:hypothetical protein